jgi:DNA-binding IclR family transcriptional regulator
MPAHSPVIARDGALPAAAPPRDASGSSRAVTTAFRILGVLAVRPAGARLSELARELDVPKSTALRILGTLCSLEVVRHDEGSQKYRIGRRLFDYVKAPLALEPELIREFYRVAAPVHQELDETIQLAILSVPDVTFIARLDSSRAVRLVTHVGRRLPAHATGVGKAILAYSDPGLVDEVIAAGLPRYTHSTITDPGQFRAVLEQVRADGYATEVEESTANLSCFSAPVFGPDGLVRAGLTICIPTGAVAEERAASLVAAVRQTAHALSSAL